MNPLCPNYTTEHNSYSELFLLFFFYFTAIYFIFLYATSHSTYWRHINKTNLSDSGNQIVTSKFKQRVIHIKTVGKNLHICSQLILKDHAIVCHQPSDFLTTAGIALTIYSLANCEWWLQKSCDIQNSVVEKINLHLRNKEASKCEC